VPPVAHATRLETALGPHAAYIQLLAFYVTLPPEQLDAFDGSTLLEPLQNLANELRLMVEPTP